MELEENKELDGNKELDEDVPFGAEVRRLDEVGSAWAPAGSVAALLGAAVAGT